MFVMAETLVRLDQVSKTMKVPYTGTHLVN